MGQESSKLLWPKPSGRYQSETGRRYGRRHAYVSYRPSTNQQERITSLRSKKTEGPMHRSAPSQIKRRSRSPFAASRRRWDNRESSGAALNAETEDYPRFPPREYRASGSRRGMPSGHTDTLRADDSEEEGAGPVDWLPARGKPGKFKDDKPCDPEKGARALAAGAPSRFSSFNRDLREELANVEPAPAARRSAHRAEFLKQNGATAQMAPAAEGRAAAKGDSSERERRGQNAPARASRAPVSVCSGGESPAKSAEEPVVRPKVRNLSTPNCMKPKVFFDTDDDEDVPHSTSRWRDAARAEEGHLDGLSRRGRGGNASHSSEPKYPEDKRDVRSHQLRREKQPRRRRALAEPDLWTYHDDYYRYYEDDSDSDKEWMAALRRRYRSREQPQASGADRWEATLGKEEREAQRAGACAGASAGASAGACAGASAGACAGASAGVSARASARACARACASAAASSLMAGATAGASVGSTGSSYLEEAQERPLPKEGRASLEEGEIPWLQYHDNESSSEGDNESSQELIQPAMFLLDGNNNLEDDSSVSEDLEVDWSLFDGFADGLGVAEAISYVDPQFLTYMALEERLAQAMETALAHLESLAVDVEVANPPASKESIDALPEIVVTEDHGAVGQEMCCPICCSEYVKGEVATELPCHHYFHKPCVSIWLQKSGTCPVCRCMLPPPM